jgi:hypothetical protein
MWRNVDNEIFKIISLPESGAGDQCQGHPHPVRAAEKGSRLPAMEDLLGLLAPPAGKKKKKKKNPQPQQDEEASEHGFQGYIAKKRQANHESRRARLGPNARNGNPTPIFKGLLFFINGSTSPVMADLVEMIYAREGRTNNYETNATHIVASMLPNAKVSVDVCVCVCVCVCVRVLHSFRIFNSHMCFFSRSRFKSTSSGSKRSQPVPGRGLSRSSQVRGW